jgi:hypothetical protein
MMWFLALLVAATSLRYFLLSPRAEDAFEARSAAGFSKIATKRPLPMLGVASHNRLLVLLHVGGGVVAMVTGLFQFVTRLRTTRPAIHRVIGRVYLGAVVIGSSGGLPLSYLALRHLPDPVRSALWPTTAAFATLALVWPFLTAMAFLRVRQRRFEEHRAWMIRSYSLTFAAVTTRLVSPLTLLLTRDALLSINVNIWTWPLNLVIAEWLIRRYSPLVSRLDLQTEHDATTAVEKDGLPGFYFPQ